MPVVRPHKIHLISRGGVPRHEEGVALLAILPGMLVAQSVTLDTSGRAKLIPHPTAGGPAEKQFAIEDGLQGRTIADQYAIGELTFTVIASTGDVIYARLAAGEDVTTEEYLTSNGDGTLKVAATTDVRVAVALEAMDLTASDAVDSNIRVRIL